MTVTVKGLARWIRNLGKVQQLTDDGVRDILGTLGEKTQIEAKRVHRYTSRSGMLSRSVKRKYSFKKSNYTHKLRVFLDARLTTVKGGKSYGEFVHNGTRPHVIRAKNKKALHWGTSFAKKVNHPGTKPDPFLTNAFNSNLPEAQKALRRLPKVIGGKIT